MKSDILIFGNGWLGNRIARDTGWVISKKRINKLSDVQEELDIYKPRVMINCIGHFGKNVDECEKDKDATLIANTYMPILLAEAAKRNNIKLVHISSGCLFHYNYNDDPIDESKEPDFFDLFYCRTKIQAESALMSMKDTNILILRPRMPLDIYPHKRNLIDKLSGFNRIIDIPNSVTYIPDFIIALEHLIEFDHRGIFNVVNNGALSLKDLAISYKRVHPEYKYDVVDMKDLNIVRTNILLSVKKLESTGINIKNINDCIKYSVDRHNYEGKNNDTNV